MGRRTLSLRVPPCKCRIPLTGPCVVRKALCRIEEIPDGGATSREVESSTGGFSVLLTRSGSAVHAFHNECPHAGRRLDWSPGRFLVEAGTVICAAHGAQFVLASGECIGGPCRGAGLKSIAIVLVDGEVQVG